MGYNKIISYGNFVELYEYEKDIVRLGRADSERSSEPRMPSVGTDGEDTLSQRDNKESLGRRPDNARRASLDFRRVVASNLGGSSSPLLVTITYRDNVTDLKEGYKDFSAYIQTLRHKFGKNFRYISVPEFQKRGAVHFHALFWGLPTEVFLQEREARTLAELWGNGFIYLKETDGNEKLSFYLSKYMSKAFIDPRLKNQKSYVASRNILRPVTQKGFSPVWTILDDHNIEEEPIVDKTYKTKWLGNGRYRLFRIRS